MTHPTRRGRPAALNAEAPAMNHATFLDRLRGIAQRGLNYARDPYDIARYNDLLALASEGYEGAIGVPVAEAEDRFRRELGYITPKVGVDGAVFSDDGTALLLIRRSDSGLWALPGGWGELGERPEDSVAREVAEETTLAVRVGDVVAVSSQLPGPDSGPHTSVHVLYHCTVRGGEPGPTAEATEVAYRRIEDVADWHGPHGEWAAKAMAWRRARGSTDSRA
jgi:ADP-ribose pyrophosphatase YjhB (NUDIX family)